MFQMINKQVKMDAEANLKSVHFSILRIFLFFFLTQVVLRAIQKADIQGGNGAPVYLK